MNTELDKKIDHACKVIEKVLEKYKNPVVCLSFGKDSVLMLHLLRMMGHDQIPCVHYRVPYFPRKHAWGEQLMSEWNLNVTHIPPVSACMVESNGKNEIFWAVQMKKYNQYFLLGKLPIEGAGKWLCGRDDLLGHPKGIMEWPWDVAFHGHKASDDDNVLGKVVIDSDIYQMDIGECALAYPIRQFTNEDVFEASLKLGVPINKARLEDKLFDPDFMPYCTKCLDRTEQSVVECPQTGLKVQNISSQIPYLNPKETFKNINFKN